MMRKLVAMVLALMIAGGGIALADYTDEAWYPEALKGCQMALGNNVRLKKVIERAQGGENITIATVGGSITEGAAAAKYAECWASQFALLFGEAYCAAGGAQANLVNCGVGGTPSPFGYMRYGREILGRIPETDPDGYPDIVVIEYAVNDWNEPTGTRCYESMVKEILQQPNEPAVILLFTVRSDGWNLQQELRKVGERYGLMMVSIRDGIYPHIDRDYPKADWYSDEYHPKSVGHRMMAEALMQAVRDAAAAETAAADIDLNVEAAYGTDFMGLKTIYGEGETEGITVEKGSFNKTDASAYKNEPVGLVCGKNFHHSLAPGEDPLKITGVFSKCLIAWKATGDSAYGTAEVWIDGGKVRTLGGTGGWGQSEVVLVLDDREEAEHTVEIRPVENNKRFTITAISVR